MIGTTILKYGPTGWIGIARLLAIAAVSMTGLLGVASAQSDTLVVGSSFDYPTLDPATNTTVGALIVHHQTYERLVRFDAQGNIVPELATSWTASDDGLRYTFELRQGVLFHDGTPFTADAVKASFDRLFAINQGPVNTFNVVDEVNVLDEYTVEFVLESPYAAFLSLLAQMFGGQIVSPAAVAANEVDGDYAQAFFQNNVVGTGPYRLVSWERGAQTVLERFDDYWGGWDHPHFQRIVLREVREVGSQRLLIQGGDIDLAEAVSLDDVPLLSSDPNLRVEVLSNPQVVYIHFHTGRGPLADQRVRQALSYAVDYEAMVDVGLRGFARRLQGPMPESIWGFDSSVEPYERDVERARELLAEAGYPDGGFTLRYMYIGLDWQRVVGEILQSNFAEVGVDVQLDSVTVAAGRAARENPETSPDMFIYYTTPRTTDPDSLLFDVFHSDGFPPRGANWSWYQNAEVDEALSSARVSTDQDARSALYSQVQHQLNADAPALFLLTQDHVLVTRADLQGIEFIPQYSRAYFYYRAYRE